MDDGVLAVDPPDDIVVERPRDRTHGDYATNVAMRLAKPAGRSPREVAQAIADRLVHEPGVGLAEVAGPGFINVTLESEALGELARTIVVAGPGYGRSDELAGQRINLEFVSANPTGPVHLGHTRWAALGDSLRRVLTAAGAEVASEHYFNDMGSQLDHFAASLQAAARGLPVPEDGYHGDYVADVAKAVQQDRPDVMELPDDDQLAVFKAEGYRLMAEQIKASLHRFGVDFDVWFSEKSLHDAGEVDAAVARLREQGHVYYGDGAVWLRTTDFGDDKDRPLIRSTGVPTYFAADAAYYLDKRARGFDRCVYLLGADHHGYIGRLRSIVACAGDDPDETLEVLIGQMVKLQQGGAELRLSKRAGTMVTLDEFVDLVGVDAGRYSLARWSADTPLTLDVDEITKRTADNPVFYVQYAHARLASLQRNAAELGFARGEDYHPSLLGHERETELLGALGEFPRVVAAAAQLREPHRIARYLESSAGAYHRFYDSCRVLPRGDEPMAVELVAARLWLVEATRVVLENGLGLLGVTAPDRM